MRNLVLAFLLLGNLAFALKTAQMQLPPDFMSLAERNPISGFGGHNKGSFSLDNFHGEFTRGESRMSLLNSLYVSNKGQSSFLLQDASSTEIISASCAMKKSAVTIDVLTFDPKKMSYQCDFTKAGQLLGSRLVLGQPKAEGVKEKLYAKDLRRGEAILFDQHLLIESVHKYEGSKLQSPAPVGYLLRDGEQVVAALELTDVNPTLFIMREASENLRHSVLATALALAVLRDPANSALED